MSRLLPLLCLLCACPRGGGGGRSIAAAVQREAVPPMPPDGYTIDPDAEPVVQLVQRAARGEATLVPDEAAGRVLSEAGWPYVGDAHRMFVGIPSDCTELYWEVESGTVFIAVQPAMVDDSDAEAAALDAARKLLGGAREVSAWCHRVETMVGDCYETSGMGLACETEQLEFEEVLGAVALHEVDGEWRTVAWRDFSREGR